MPVQFLQHQGHSVSSRNYCLGGRLGQSLSLLRARLGSAQAAVLICRGCQVLVADPSVCPSQPPPV